MERYRIFMKRFELSEDFMAQMTVEQRSKLNLVNLVSLPQQMFEFHFAAGETDLENSHRIF